MGEHKEKTGKTRAGKFLQGLKGVAPIILQLASTVTGVDELKDLANMIKGDDSISPENTVTALELLKLDIQQAEQITRRWESDNKSNDWLPRNIRPLVVANFTLLIDFVLIASQFGRPIAEDYLPILMTMGVTSIGGYFTLREYGKTKK